MSQYSSSKGQRSYPNSNDPNSHQAQQGFSRIRGQGESNQPETKLTIDSVHGYAIPTGYRNATRPGPSLIPKTTLHDGAQPLWDGNSGGQPIHGFGYGPVYPVDSSQQQGMISFVRFGPQYMVNPPGQLGGSQYEPIPQSQWTGGPTATAIPNTSEAGKHRSLLNPTAPEFCPHPDLCAGLDRSAVDPVRINSPVSHIHSPRPLTAAILSPYLQSMEHAAYLNDEYDGDVCSSDSAAGDAANLQLIERGGYLYKGNVPSSDSAAGDADGLSANGFIVISKREESP